MTGVIAELAIGSKNHLAGGYSDLVYVLHPAEGIDRERPLTRNSVIATVEGDS